MTAEDIHVGATNSGAVRYVVEGETDGGFRTVDAEVVARDWDVTDSEARYEAAVEELGPITNEHKQHIGWFINEERNAAALCVFRPW